MGTRQRAACTPIAARARGREPGDPDDRGVEALPPHRLRGPRRAAWAKSAWSTITATAEAGITMSWGTSKLAIELGLKGHSGPVAVIGSGVVGLSTARLVQEAGFPVTIYAAALPPDTTSNVAGGQFHPFGLFRDDLSRRRSGRSSCERSTTAGGGTRSWSATITASVGCRPMSNRTRRNRGTSPTSRRSTALWHRSEHPFPLDKLVVYDTMYIETGRYLRQMIRDVHIAGGKIEVRRFATPADFAALPEALIFNCTGLGSRDLFGDQELEPRRGQLAILEPQPNIRYAVLGQFGYMFPRADGILLGGTLRARRMGPDAAAGGHQPDHRFAEGVLRRLPLHRLKRRASPPIYFANELPKHHLPERRDQRIAEGQAHPQGDRRRAQRAYRRPGRREARGRRGASQSLAAPAAVARTARRGHAEEHLDDRPDGLRKDRDQPPPGEARRCAVREGRGDQVHRGRLCRPRRRADRPRPGRGSGPARARTPPRGGSQRRRGSGHGAAARCADRQGLQRRDPRKLPPALRGRQPRSTPRSRSRCRKRRRRRSRFPEWAARSA